MKQNLTNVIQGIKEIKNINNFNEDQTKLGIILKILQSLGWDIFNTIEVYPEYPVSSGKVDYSIRYNNISKVFIEAKKTTENLEKHQEQLLKYSFHESCSMSILTNGITWWFYLPLKVDVKWDQRKFFTINIDRQNSEDIADYLIDFLSKENVISGKNLINAENILNKEKIRKLLKKTLPLIWSKLLTETNPKLIDIIADETENECGHRPNDELIRNFIYRNILNLNEVPKKENQNQVTKEKNISKKITYNVIKGKKPISFSIKGRKYSVKSWADLWIKFLEYFYLHEKEAFTKICELKGKKRKYFTKDINELFRYSQVNKSGIFAEINFSAIRFLDLCYKSLDIAGLKYDSFTIELEN